MSLPVYGHSSYLLPLLIKINSDSSHLKIRHRRSPRSFDHCPVQARLTQMPTFRLSLKPSSIRLFPCSSDTAPSSSCGISALQPQSTRSLPPSSRQMKYALLSLNTRSLLSLARCRTPIPSRRRSRSLKTREEDMVRHEAAEALGGIATDEADEVLPVLRKWAAKDDAPRVVREGLCGGD